MRVGGRVAMQNIARFIYIPGDNPVNVFEAIKKALAKFPRVKTPSKIVRQYPVIAAKAIASTRPRIQKPAVARVLPYSRRTVRKRAVHESPKEKNSRVKRELLDAGMTFYGLLKSETKVLPKVLHPHEHVEAVVYGQHHSSSVMLVATNERIIFLDKKPMAAFLDEVSYEVVSGIEFGIHLFTATLVLHTPVRNYDIHNANLKCAEKFARHIETKRLIREKIEEEIDGESTQFIEQPSVVLPEPQKREYPAELDEDLAGYYLLPTDEEERRKTQEVIV